MTQYQIDCTKFCGYVSVDDNGIIIETMPVFQKFKGQHLSNLSKWVEKKFGYCTLQKIKSEE